MLIEVLAAKGVLAIGKLIAGKAVLAKATAIAAKLAISHYGLGTVLSTTFTVGVVAGGLVWTKERVEDLFAALSALQDGNYSRAITKFAQLANVLGVDVTCLPDLVEQYLLKIRVSADQASAIAETIANYEPEIAQELAARF